MTLRAWLCVFLQSLKKTFSYRANFWMQFFGAVAGDICIAFLLWGAIFLSSGLETIGSLTLNEMLRYYVISAFLSRMVRGQETFMVSFEIYEGGLTKYLILPGHYILYKLAEISSDLLMALFQTVVGMTLVLFFFSAEVGSQSLDLKQIIMCLVLSVLAGFFSFFLNLLVELSAFWIDNVWTLSVMVRFITSFFSGMLLPLSLYPEFLIKIINFTPFASMIYVPTQIALGGMGWPEFVGSIGRLAAWSVVLFFGIRLVWTRGVRQYTGVGQ